MKKSFFASILCIIVFSVILSACSSDSGQSAQSQTASGVSSFVSSVGENVSSTVSYIVKSDYNEWTYTDWNAADEQRKESCREYFSNQISQETTADNLGKIFGTNQDKKLSEIIKIQKENLQAVSSVAGESSVQPDPGHGAAAGY